MREWRKGAKARPVVRNKSTVSDRGGTDSYRKPIKVRNGRYRKTRRAEQASIRHNVARLFPTRN